MTDLQPLLLKDPSQFRDLSNWDVDLKQIEPGEITARASAWSGANLQIVDLSFDKAVLQVGTSREGHLAFGLPDPGSLKTWFGKPVDATPVMMFGTQHPFEGISSHRFTGITFTIEAVRAAHIADICGLDVEGILARATRSAMSSSGVHHTWLRHMARQLIANGAGSCSPADEEDLILLLLEKLASVRHWKDNENANRRERATRVAVDVMFDHLEEPLSIPNICAYTGVSAPTLRRGFLDCYGVSPKQFYLRARLGKVRAELAAEPGARSIGDVANDFGFWHMGQFAKDYRSFFGELPSQTATLAPQHGWVG